MKIKYNTIDLIALSSSITCAVHCAAIPLLLSFSSVSSLKFLENPYIEWTFISFGLVFVLTSLWPTYKKVHHQVKPLQHAVLGFAFIATGRLNLIELWEVFNTVIGASLIALAHYLNWKLVQKKGNHKH